MNGVESFAVFILVLFLIPSAVLGLYSALLYHLVKKLPGKFGNAAPLVFALLFLFMMRFPPHVTGDLIVLAGYLMLFAALTGLVFLTITPLSLLEIFVRFRKGEVVAFACTTVSLAIFFIRGFSETMSVPSPDHSVLLVYLELLGTSFFITIIALAVEMLGEGRESLN